MDLQQTNIFAGGQVLFFDKPLYWTSFDLVNKVRIIIRQASEKQKIKVGHAGTLDPLASGLMIVCTGKATKKIEQFRDLDKEYEATIFCGRTTPSFDLETETDGEYPVSHITEQLVLEALEKMKGVQKQIPPLHSAKLVEGKRAYELARKGDTRQLEAVPVIFHELELLSFELPEIRIRILCSKGTYIRAFARDLGIMLGSGCYLSSLVRTRIGGHSLENAFSIEKFNDFVEQLKQNGNLYV